MLWSLNRVLKATVRGARDSRVSLLIGLCWHQARPTSTKTVSGIAATARQRRQPRNNIFIRPGWAPPGAHGSLLWARTGEVRAKELAGAGQGSVGFVEDRREALEHVRDAGCDFEPDGDLGRGGAGGKSGGVVEEDLV